MDSDEVLMRVYSHLRDELISMQRMRTRLYVFKITALGAIYFAAVYTGDVRVSVAVFALALAPIIASLYDLGIEGMSAAIREIGGYIRTHIEPHMPKPARRGGHGTPFQAYEQHLAARAASTPKWKLLLRRRALSQGLTLLTFVVSAIAILPNWELVANGLEMHWSSYVLWVIVCVGLATAVTLAYPRTAR